MGFLNIFKKKTKKRNFNIVVYYVSAIKDGVALATPLGVLPAFPKQYEIDFKIKHNPTEGDYFNEEINGNTAVCFWKDNRIEAISFLSAEHAKASPYLIEFSSEDIKTLDPILNHFPRN